MSRGGFRGGGGDRGYRGGWLQPAIRAKLSLILDFSLLKVVVVVEAEEAFNSAMLALQRLFWVRDSLSHDFFKISNDDFNVEMGTFVHAVEGEMLCSSTMLDKVPYFNAPIYLQNKSVIGKVDEILGPINEVYFSIKMGEGMVASSFKQGDKVYIAGDKLLPLDRFLPKPKVPGGGKWLSRLQVMRS